MSRRAAIQRTLLPVMLGWFADAADPDAGLLAFRRVSDALGTTPWYLRLLRDEGAAAERLAHVLARSRYAADLLVARARRRSPLLGDADGLTPRAARRPRGGCRRRPAGSDDPDRGRRARSAACAGASCSASPSPTCSGSSTCAQVGTALTDLAAAVLEAALSRRRRGSPRQHGAAADPAARRRDGPPRRRRARLRLATPTCCSCTSPSRAPTTPGAGRRRSPRSAGAAPPARPGRPGPGARARRRPAARGQERAARPHPRVATAPTTSGGRSIWESQALLRATPVAGDAELGERFVALVDPLR